MPGREDMGALLGITTETASRVMAEFRRRGLIQRDKSNELVCDHTALTQLANS